jgi:5-methyltetrahydrofolate--homocysteine methyltransferase
MLKDIRNLLLELSDVEELKRTVSETLGSGIDPRAIIDVLNETLNEVGEKYERGDLFLSELMMVGYLASEVTALLKPHLVGAELETRGKIVFGTVSGDVHDIGKNIVIMMLQSAGFEVVDLGVDVSAERFIEAVEEENPDVLCMSALLTSTMHEMRVVIDSLEKVGLRSVVKVIVGGRPIAGEFASEIGADGHAEDAVKAVRVIKELIGMEGGD